MARAVPASSFRPHPLLRNGHAMTVAGALLPRRLRGFLRRAQEFFLPVGSDTRVRIEAHWQPDPDAAVLVLVHGLGGHARKCYMAGTASKAWRRGLSVLRLNLRNAGGTEHLTPTLYHAGLSDDLEAAVEWLARERRPARIVVAGFSLGGSIALHAAARWGGAPPEGVAGLVTVSTPFDLAAASAAMHRGGLHRVYVRSFLASFRDSWKRKARHLPQHYPPDGMRAIRSIRDFDERWVAPAFGFAGAADYYQRASPLRVLDRVRLPVLVIHAADDPFVPLTAEARAAIASLPNLRLHETNHGGHCAFYGAEPAGGDLDRWWAENRVVEAALW
ncbi:MAG: alpha/beta fold hydrolase [Planctomycetota bacterium]|nr:MAG: alpha/beta fold hydrolase [Planctomycetota bacterium]